MKYRELEVNFGGIGQEQIIKLPDSGILNIKPTYVDYCLSRNVKEVKLEVKGKKIKHENKFLVPMFRTSIADVISRELSDKGAYVENLTMRKGAWYGNRINWKLRYDFNNRYSILHDTLKSIGPLPRFNYFQDMTKDYVLVSMIGHKEGGSYTYAKDWASMYIEDMQKIIPCRIEFIKHSTGGFGWDNYLMKIHTKGV